MALNLELANRSQTTPRVGPANTIAVFGASSAGEYGRGYEFTDAARVQPTLGYGSLPELLSSAVDNSKVRQVGFRVQADTPGSVGSVSKTGSGPVITATGASYHDLPNLKWKITRAGAYAVGQFAVALDGVNYQAAIDIPAPAQAAIRGLTDLTGLTLSSLNGLTLLITASVGSEQTITFTTPASVADIATQANAGSTGMTFSIVEGRYLMVVDDVAGATSSLSINATSTADTVLGMSGAASGAASAYTIPATNITLGFASGPYELGEVYSAAATGPRYTTTALATAITAARNSGVEFGDVASLQTPVDAAEAVSFAQAIATAMAGWQSGTPRLFSHAVCAAPLGATGDAGIETNDTAVKNAFNAAAVTSNLVTVAHGDCYYQGRSIPGSFRRPAVWPLAVRMCSHRLSADPGSGGLPSLPEVSMVSPDGVTKARDEDTAVVKMREQRFTVLRNRDGAPAFARGVTRADPGGPTPAFQHLGVIRMGLLMLRLVLRVLKRWENIDPPTEANGTIRVSLAKSMNRELDRVLRSGLVDEGHAADVRAAVDQTERIASTNNITALAEARHNAQLVNVTGRLSIVDTFEFSS